MKKIPHIGNRIIKTMIAVFLSILIYVILLYVDKLLGLNKDETWKAPSNMYTPFFASIAAVYATHQNSKASFKQAKIRSAGSLIGGYFGMLIILLFEYFFIDLWHLDSNNFILYKLIEFIVVSLGIIPLIEITLALKQNIATFITCLTYLSVTISIRNGGMPVFQFATNRILSTLVGVGLSLLVNNIYLFKYRNKNILFVSSLDNNFLSEDGTISPYLKYKLNDLYYQDMNLCFATTRTLTSLSNIFKDIEVRSLMVIMNGSAIYDFDNKTYSNIKYLKNDVRIELEQAMQKNDLQAFSYSINENVLHCYHNAIRNSGERKYIEERKQGQFYAFVRGQVPCDLKVSLYIVIDTKEKILQFIDQVNASSIKDEVDLVLDTSLMDKYYYLKINSRDARKENSIHLISKTKSYNYLVVCGSGKTDIPLMKEADLSICLHRAPNYVKEHADYILNDNPENVLKLFDKLYHSKNTLKIIQKYKMKKTL